jgi:phage terminase large subunit-like protein
MATSPITRLSATKYKGPRSFSTRQIGFDRVFAGEIVQQLQGVGLEMIEVGQGFLSMAAPMAELLRLVRGGKLWHGGHPVLRWMASNLSVRTAPAGNLKPDKEKSSDKIDGISALCNALAITLGSLESSPYSDGRSLLML